MGREYLIEAPDGLILIEAHSGLSFDEDFAAIEHAGLDPMRVKYVLATHEHGDHTPGAYLWRVVTGAKLVAAREAAYTLKHHIPMGTGYGFHPPVPTDIAVDDNCELNLAGLPVRGLRAPGHTFGSMAWMFDREGKSYLATGDLVGPGGKLGYSGSVNFSAHDALQSLEKLDALGADFLLPGHGAPEDARVRLAAGQRVGRATGWNRIRPSHPEPRFGITAENVMVVGRLVSATSADVGDLDADGRPDVAVVSPMAEGSVVRIYLNHGGRFTEQPDETILVKDVENPWKIRVCHLDGDQPADILASRHKGWSCVGLAGETVDHPSLEAWLAQLKGSYADLRELDVNGDGRTDLLNSYGLVFLRQTDSTFPSSPTLKLPSAKDDWTLIGVGDFNGDGVDDLMLGKAKTRGVLILLGGPDGLSPSRSISPDIEFLLHHETGLCLADFDADGDTDLAAFGYTQGTEPGFGYGPLGLFIWLQKRRVDRRWL